MRFVSSIFVVGFIFLGFAGTVFAEPSQEEGDADEAWVELIGAFAGRGAMPQSEEKLSFYQEMIRKLSHFLEDHPKAENAKMARSIRAQLMIDSYLLGREESDLAFARKEIQELATEAEVSDSAMRIYRLYLLKAALASGPPEDLAERLREYEAIADLREQPIELRKKLGEKLKSVLPERGATIVAEAENEAAEKALAAKEEKAELEALLQQPDALKFTAVDGREVDLNSLRGKVVLVDFWATWCAPCMKEVPHIVEAYDKFHEQGFEVIGISFDQSKKDVLRVTDREKMTWPQYFDGKGWDNEIGKHFNIQAIPQMWLIDQDGNLAELNAREHLEEKIVELLKK